MALTFSKFKLPIVVVVILLFRSWSAFAAPAPGPLLGDVNFDGHVDLLDIVPLTTTILTGNYNYNADVNQDGSVNLLDVAPMIEILIGTEISPIQPASIEGFEIVPSDSSNGDVFQFTIRFDNHAPNSIIAFNSVYVGTFIRVRNKLTDAIVEGRVITFDIDVVEMDFEGQESVGLIDARMVIDWMFFDRSDFGPNGDYVVDFVRIDLELPSFKDNEGDNIVGTIERTGF